MVHEETREQMIILKMIVLLFNLRSCCIGINQILNTYMPALNWNANEEIVAPILGLQIENYKA